MNEKSTLLCSGIPCSVMITLAFAGAMASEHRWLQWLTGAACVAAWALVGWIVYNGEKGQS